MIDDNKNKIENCAFCAIARGENRFTEVICESGDWVAFFPLNPATPGHTLVIPRFHVADLWAMEPYMGAELMTALIELGRAICSSLAPEGMNLITSSGGLQNNLCFIFIFIFFLDGRKMVLVGSGLSRKKVTIPT